MKQLKFAKAAPGVAMAAMFLQAVMPAAAMEEDGGAKEMVVAVGRRPHLERKAPAVFDGRVELQVEEQRPEIHHGPRSLFPSLELATAPAVDDDVLHVRGDAAELVDVDVVTATEKTAERMANTLSGVTHAELTQPKAGEVLDRVQRFQWSEGGKAQMYWLWVGSCRDCTDLFDQSTGLELTRLVNIPGDGRTVYVTLFTQVGGEWYWEDYSFRASSGSQPATLTSPTAGATLTASQQFVWNAGSGVSEYWLSVGTCKQCGDLYDKSAGSTRTATVPFAANGRVVYVTLWSLIGGQWFDREYEYRAPSVAPPATATIRITNYLHYPIEIFVNNAKVGTAAGASLDTTPVPGVYTRTYSPAPSSIQVTFVMVQPTVEGARAGVPVNGSFPRVSQPKGTYNWTATNVFSASTIFMPLISNRLGEDRYLEVNAGRSTHKDCGCKVANNVTNFRAGYYFLTSNSNVRLWQRGLFGIGIDYWLAGEDANGTVSAGGRLTTRVDSRTGYFRWVPRK